MIQKLRRYEVHRAKKQYNEIGEEICGEELVFPLEAIIDLRQGDVIVDDDSQYRVDYVYHSLRRGVAYLRLGGDYNGR